MATTIRAEIDIAAEPEQVWEMLTDFAAYEAWNPYIVSAAGRASKGERLTLAMRVAGKVFKVRPRVVVAAGPRQLRWAGSLGIRGLFDADHKHDLEATPAGTRYIQSERFSGALVPLLRNTIAATSVAFDAMNQALKVRVEEGLGSPHALRRSSDG